MQAREGFECIGALGIERQDELVDVGREERLAENVFLGVSPGQKCRDLLAVRRLVRSISKQEPAIVTPLDTGKARQEGLESGDDTIGLGVGRALQELAKSTRGRRC